MAIITNTNLTYNHDTMKSLARLCKLAKVQVEDCRLTVKDMQFESLPPTNHYMGNDYRYFTEFRAVQMATMTVNASQLEDMLRAYYRYTRIRSRFHKEIQELELMAVMHGVIETDF